MNQEIWFNYGPFYHFQVVFHSKIIMFCRAPASIPLSTCNYICNHFAWATFVAFWLRCIQCGFQFSFFFHFVYLFIYFFSRHFLFSFTLMIGSYPIDCIVILTIFISSLTFHKSNWVVWTEEQNLRSVSAYEIDYEL